MKTKRIVLPLLLTLGLATSMFAQASGTTFSPANRVQHRVSFLTTLLTLTPAQQQQATTIFTNAATANTAVYANLKTARQNLWTAVQNDDTSSITSITNSIGTLTAQLSANNAQADAAFYKTLTADQQAKLTQLHSLRHGHFRP